MLKVELHAHSADDPHDRIPHTTFDLIDRAEELGYQALAVTLHDHQLDLRPFASYAGERGIVLIPGIERTIEGRHVLLLNFRGGAERVASFEDLARLRQSSSGLVVAPHPFFPLGSCLRELMDPHASLFDAVEINAMYTSTLDFNRRAEEWAGAHGKPLVGNCDVHRLYQMGTTYSLVDAEPTADSICAAIAAGAVHVERAPISWMQAARTMTDLTIQDVARYADRLVGGLPSIASPDARRRPA